MIPFSHYHVFFLVFGSAKSKPNTSSKLQRIPELLASSCPYHVLKFNSLIWLTWWLHHQRRKAPQESLRKSTNLLVQSRRRERLNEPFSHHAMLKHILQYPMGVQIIKATDNSEGHNREKIK